VNLSATIKHLLKGSGKRTFRNALGGQFTIENDHVILKKEGRILASLLKKDEYEAVVLLHDVKIETLHLVIEYCHFHSSTCLTEKERKVWVTKFVDLDPNVLFELASVRLLCFLNIPTFSCLCVQFILAPRFLLFLLIFIEIVFRLLII
jgi:hypothetical protein